MAVKEIMLRFDKEILDVVQSYCNSKGMSVASFMKKCVINRVEELSELNHIKEINKNKIKLADIASNDYKVI